MTEITFHFNVSDRLHHSCRLVRKAFLKGASVVVIGEKSTLQKLDSDLWQLCPTEFVPHCRRDSPEVTLTSTPVVLADTLNGLDRQGVLINLGPSVPDEFERFDRLIEVVTADESDKLAARQRWKHYANRGYVLKQHNAAAGLAP